METKEMLKQAGVEQATMVGGARTKGATHTPVNREGAAEYDYWICYLKHRMSSLLYGKEKASDAVIMNKEPVAAEKVPIREFREKNFRNEKPSPKLQPVNTNTQPIRIQQPL